MAEDNGRNNLEAAMALLIHNQAQFVSDMSEINRRNNELREETAKRFDRIEALLLQHNEMLKNHNQLLKNLPEAIREKTGFKQ